MTVLPLHGPSASLARLREGNARFTANASKHPAAGPADRMATLDGQSPFATIVSCSDSRVPPEIVFDCGIGELFVIRTAGNVLDDIGLGSVLYAVEHLECPLVVVLGHESCGAVTAALMTDEQIGTIAKPLRILVDMVRSQIPQSLAEMSGANDRLRMAIEEHMQTTVESLRRMEVVKERISSGSLEIVTGYYSLSKGTVTFGYTRT